MRRLLALSAASVLAACASTAMAQTAPAPAASAEVAAPAPAAPPVVKVITPNPSADIIANLKAAGQFTTFLKAMDGSGLTPLLQKPGAFTVFAPTDAAFAAVPAGEMDNLLKPENAAKLQAVMAYYIVNAKLADDQVVGHAATPVPTVINKPITIDGVTKPIKVNDASVLQAGVPASNGVIYVIDKVLTAPQ